MNSISKWLFIFNACNEGGVGWDKQQVENRGIRTIVAIQSTGWDQELSNVEEGNVLEMESGDMVSSPGFTTNDLLSMEPTCKDSMR